MTRTPAGGYPQPQGRPASASSASSGTQRTERGPSDLLDEVEFVLSDARERAQAIIDESTERARELIRRERAATSYTATGIDPGAFEDLRRGLRGLVTEVRDIQQRLARIEDLLHRQNERMGVSPPTSMPAPRQPSFEEPRSFETEPVPAWRTPHPTYNEPQYHEPSYDDPHEEPETEEFEPTEPTERAEPGSPVAPPSPAPVPPRAPFSVVPPQRREWVSDDDDDGTAGQPSAPAAFDQPPPSPTRAAFGRAEPSPSVEPSQPWDDEAHDEYDEPAERESTVTSASPLATFLPSDGAITLRVSPVSGFQGLMRVQDALTRLPFVRHAGVEAYSQGEARLRVELADSADSDELAEGLARALRGSARVEDASEVNRELLIALR